ncbi:Ubiquitin carboxyl-terminal hydrolase MINDY-2 [Merluccius polli]|uniref:Ubiquitin carboxyl-terminal hydrolase n=1 Tax=Merluccius polli TaxID=89951 RepID=A0AA47MBU3_MERPO|nr:Ubiquitin carboxyl-terminal hydrolase MINDY-2 [Merluccius polli]
MEKNASLHHARDTTSLSPASAGAIKDVATPSAMKGTDGKCKSSGTSVHVSCNDSTGTGTAVRVGPVAAETDANATLPLNGRDAAAGTGRRPDPELRGRTGGEMDVDDDDSENSGEGGASKLGTSGGLKGGPPATGTRTDALDAGGGRAQVDTFGPTKPVQPKHPADAVSPTDVESSGSGSPAGLQGTGDPESRSVDSSLESFSNLHSCPSSELNSECLEERGGLASSLRGESGGGGGGADETHKAASCAKDRDQDRDRAGPTATAGQSIYHIKWIKWKDDNTPIITQNENGPCPLLAIMNVLLLAWKVKMPPMMEIITAEQLMEYLGDYILDSKPKEISEAQRLNYEQNMSDAMAVLHKLQTGLDVNVKFTGVRVFEYTPECIVFDLLDIPLYHGWLVDPQMHDIVKAVGNCSYNQLVEKIISCKQSENSELAGEGIVAEQFLSSTATQLTYHGLCELTSTVQEGELCVFFRNNHFSTMIKYKDQLYHLVTDQGFLTEEKVVWESLHNVDGDGNFCDSEFRLRPPSDPETVYRGQQDQIDQDYLMALSLQQQQQGGGEWEQLPEGISDLQLAKKLQEEEDRRASQYYQEQEQAAAEGQGQVDPAGADQGDGDTGAAAAGAVPGTGTGTGTETEAAAGSTSSPGKQSSTGERKSKKESKDKDKCVIL